MDSRERQQGGRVNSDQQLAARIRSGDGEALAQLVERYHGPLVGYLYRMTGGQAALADDLCQETFVRVLKGITGYRGGSSVKTWLYSIATNLARDYFRSASTRRDRPLMDVERLPDDGDLEHTVIDAQDAVLIVRALAELPEHQRETIVLRFYQDLSLADIAEVLNVPTGTVKSRLSLGLQRLKNSFRELEAR
jgi:RNA polymerase sigma-70 factor (ECF subfamily)